MLKVVVDEADVVLWNDLSRRYWEVLHLQFAATDAGLQIDPTLAHPVRQTQLQFVEEAHRPRAELLVRLADWQDATWLNVGAWCGLRIATGTESDAILRMLTDSFRAITSFDRLWRAFLLALDSTKNLPLSDWEMFDVDRDEGTLETDRHLGRYFALAALATRPPVEEGRVGSLVAPSNAVWIKEVVASALQEIRETRPMWGKVLGDADTSEHEQALSALVDAMLTAEADKRRSQLMEQPASPGSVQQFRDSFLAEWLEKAYLRRLFEEHGMLERYQGEPPPGSRWVSHALFESKQYFLEGSRMAADLGRALGHSMATGEIRAMFEELRQQAYLPPLTGPTIAETLSTLIECMDGLGLPAGVILFRGHWDTLHALEGSEHFGRLRPGDPLAGKVYGLLRGIPIYRAGQDPESEFLLLSLPALGRLTQYCATDREIFRVFSIDDYTPEQADQVADSDPSRLPAEWGKMDRAELVEQLRQSVRIHIQQAFELRVHRRMAAWGLRANAPSEPDMT